MTRTSLVLALLAVCGLARAQTVTDMQSEARLFRGVPADRIFERGYNQILPTPDLASIDFYERPIPIADGFCRSIVYRVTLDRDHAKPLAERQTGVYRLGRYRIVGSSADCAAFKTVQSFFEAPDEPTALQGVALLRRAMAAAEGANRLGFPVQCSDFSRARPCATKRRRLATLRADDLLSVSRGDCPGRAPGRGPGRICYGFNMREFEEPRITIVSDARGSVLGLDMEFDLPRAIP